MQPRVVLIAGSSSERGIDRATARKLAELGHVVYATVRGPTAAVAAPDVEGPGRIEVRSLDLLDRPAMAPLLDEIVATEDPPLAAQSGRRHSATPRPCSGM